MPLAHFTNIDSHNELLEPVHKNLFEINFVLPSALAIDTDKVNYLMENAINISLPSYPELPTMEQRFKYSTRMFVGVPDTTSIKGVNIKFNVLKSNEHEILVFRMLKDWYDLSWNNETGELNYKVNTIGSITVNQHDKDGVNFII